MYIVHTVCTYTVHSSLKLGQRRAKDGQDQEISTSLEWRRKGCSGAYISAMKGGRGSDVG